MREFASWLLSLVYGSGLGILYFIWWILPNEQKGIVLFPGLFWIGSTILMAIVINDAIRRQDD